MRVALDTNRYTDFARNDASIVALLEACESIGVPFVVVGELRAGFAAGRRGRENEAALARFLAKDGVIVLHSAEATTRHYASLALQLRAQGTKIPTNDLWIAALSLEHGRTRVTRDAHFRYVPQLPLA